MINLLMSAVGGDVACATLRALKRSNLCECIYGFDIREINQGRLYVDNFAVAPSYDDAEAYETFVVSICKKGKITHFWPITEKEIAWANQKRRQFDDLGVTLIINNPMILDICTSKYKTVNFLLELGISAPRTLRMEEIYKGEKNVDAVGFPLILKHDFGCGSHDIQRINTLEEWENLDLYQYEGYVVQQYIDSEKEYTVGVFSNTSDIVSIVLKRKLGFGGMSVEIETVNDEKVLRLTKKIASRIGLDGCINIQMREFQDDYYIFEINPRISSTVGFRDLLGYKDAVWWLDSKSERKYKIEYVQQVGIKGIKTLGEVLFNDGKPMIEV